jgi:sigma-B regulation protein RsbU (phosphoserine phosphatase)
VLRPGSVERLHATGVALGIVPDAVYDVLETTLAPGDRLFLFTDGITEANDALDNEYGEERLEARLTAQGALSPPDLVESVREDVLAFCGNMRPRDDMTMMLVAR